MCLAVSLFTLTFTPLIDLPGSSLLPRPIPFLILALGKHQNKVEMSISKLNPDPKYQLYHADIWEKSGSGLYFHSLL